jgi:hypothetical protein
VAVDSIGFSTTVRSERLHKLWHHYSGFAKAHVAVEVSNLKVIAVIVTDDTAYDAEALVEHVKPEDKLQSASPPRHRGRDQNRKYAGMKL